MSDPTPISCPWCDFTVDDADMYAMAQHIGTVHKWAANSQVIVEQSRDGRGRPRIFPRRCACGYKLRGWGAFTEHLRNVGDLGAHFAEARLKP